MEQAQILKSDGSVYEHVQEDIQEDCPHTNKQNVAGAGMVSEMIVCVDCGKEL